jgi:hypothetical protein
MSVKTKFGYNKCLKKDIGNVKIYLYYGWDLIHGKGWFAHSYHYYTYNVGFGFSKNKFRAVKNSIKDLK